MANLGDLVKDEVSGYTGVVLAKLEGLYEATQCRVHPRTLADNGEIRSGTWLDDDRLAVIEETAIVGFKNVSGIHQSALENK